MTKNRFFICISFLFIILISSCNTYTNFYSETYTRIPKSQYASHMHRLDFSHQNLDTLPYQISEINDLRMLNLSGNPNLNLSDALQKLKRHKNLEILILDSLQLSEIPETIKNFSNLKQLSLAYNPNLDLGKAFDLISELQLEFLNLKGNDIDELPYNITALQTLKDLNLSYNTLRAPSNYILLGKLPKLYSLWIDHNQIETLPKTIGHLNQIRFLYLDHNVLKTLPTEMSSMQKLWVVHAGYNEFEELPEVFAHMRSLFMVHINNSDIKTIPEAFKTEKYPLAGLILDNNPISEEEKRRVEKLFKSFFLLSFEQK